MFRSHIVSERSIPVKGVLWLGMSGDATIENPPLSGRRAEAARNNGRILEAAREVFVSDPNAPISAVAERAGVGIGALYRRYASKDELLQKLCGDGLSTYITEAEAALANDADPWSAFTAFMHRVVAAGAGSLTVRLAGTFTPTEALYRAAAQAHELNVRLVARAKAAGVLRPDLDVTDLSMIFEQLAAIRLGTEERTGQLRRRYLALLLNAMHTTSSSTPLPEPAPTQEELQSRWGVTRVT